MSELAGHRITHQTSDYLKKDWLRLTQKRIDVLAETVDSWIIIELRARATSSVLGRLMVYGKLWRDEQPDENGCG